MAEPNVSEQVLTVMREDWDRRALEDARYYVYSADEPVNDREFFRSGEINVANEVMPDMFRICGGSRSPLDLDVLEIGCGAGRMTRAMARIFRNVTAIDVSAEMVRQAKANLKGIDNVRLLVGDGATLSGIDDHSHDFAFSFIVFQHVPSYDVVASYCREVNRVLRPGSLFKLQVQGVNWAREEAPDTWQGVSFSQEDAFRLCKETGFVFERSAGAGSQYFWLWFRKPLTAAPPAEAKSDQAPEGTVPTTNRYLEDLKIGDKFETASAPMSEEAIMDFARQWDPQPMHLDHPAAAQSPYKGIIASGWHTAAMVMKLTAEAKPMGDVEVLGLGVTEMQWPQPVRPGDTVRVEMEVTGVRPSKSQPRYGIVSVTSTAYNQRGEVVFVVRPNLWVPRRLG